MALKISNKNRKKESIPKPIESRISKIEPWVYVYVGVVMASLIAMIIL